MNERSSETMENQVLHKHFGEFWRWWRWLSRQFSATSLGVIGFMAVAGGGYIVNLHRTIAEQGTRIALLEGRVIPILEKAAEITAMDHRLTAMDARITTLETAMQVTTRDQGDRLTRLEDDWDGARTEAGKPIKLRNRRRGR